MVEKSIIFIITIADINQNMSVWKRFGMKMRLWKTRNASTQNFTKSRVSPVLRSAILFKVRKPFKARSYYRSGKDRTSSSRHHYFRFNCHEQTKKDLSLDIGTDIDDVRLKLMTSVSVSLCLWTALFKIQIVIRWVPLNISGCQCSPDQRLFLVTTQCPALSEVNISYLIIFDDEHWHTSESTCFLSIADILRSVYHLSDPGAIWRDFLRERISIENDNTSREISGGGNSEAQ